MADLCMWIAWNDRWLWLTGVIGTVIVVVGLIAWIAGRSVSADVTDHEDGEKS